MSVLPNVTAWRSHLRSLAGRLEVWVAFAALMILTMIPLSAVYRTPVIEWEGYRDVALLLAVPGSTLVEVANEVLSPLRAVSGWPPLNPRHRGVPFYAVITVLWFGVALGVGALARALRRRVVGLRSSGRATRAVVASGLTILLLGLVTTLVAASPRVCLDVMASCGCNDPFVVPEVPAAATPGPCAGHAELSVMEGPLRLLGRGGTYVGIDLDEARTAGLLALSAGAVLVALPAVVGRLRGRAAAVSAS